MEKSTEKPNLSETQDGHRILIVDDHFLIRRILYRGLTKAGYIVEEAENGLLALMRLREKIPDLIIMDMMMNEMDGIEAIKQIRETPKWKDIPIIMLSGNSLKKNISKALENGASDYLLKPVDMHEMLKRIDKHLKLEKT